VTVDTFCDSGTYRKAALLRGQAKIKKNFRQCLSGFEAVLAKIISKSFWIFWHIPQHIRPE